GTQASITSWTDSSIVAAVPLSRTAGSAPIVVTGQNEGGSSPAGFTVNSVANSQPHIVASVSPVANDASCNNSHVTVTLQCMAGSTPLSNRTETQTIPPEGSNQVVNGTATDSDGQSASTRVSLNIDKTAPTISASIVPEPNAAGWNNTEVVVRYDCADSL